MLAAAIRPTQQWADGRTGTPRQSFAERGRSLARAPARRPEQPPAWVPAGRSLYRRSSLRRGRVWAGRSDGQGRQCGTSWPRRPGCSTFKAAVVPPTFAPSRSPQPGAIADFRTTAQDPENPRTKSAKSHGTRGRGQPMSGMRAAFAAVGPTVDHGGPLARYRRRSCQGGNAASRRPTRLRRRSARCEFWR
jgi:hypothetical protein